MGKLMKIEESQFSQFKFNDNMALTATMIEEEPWFVAHQVASSLEYAETANMKKVIDLEDRKTVSLMEIVQNGRSYKNQLLINESGLYQAIFHSTMPKAKEFRRWVTSEVLPSIRKHGGYINGQEDMSGDELMAKALIHAQSVIKEKDERLAKQQQKIDMDAPKVDFHNAVVQADDTFDMAQVAKTLNVSGIGRNSLYSYLREKGVIQPKSTQPYQRYVDSGDFEIAFVHKNGHTYPKTVATAKGVNRISTMMRNDGLLHW